MKEPERAEELLHDWTKKGIHNIQPTKFKDLFLVEEKQIPGFLQHFATFKDRKTGKTKDIYDYILSKLKQYAPANLFFEVNKKGEKVIVKRGLNTIGKKLGIPNLPSYVMRHTRATLAADPDIPKETISALLL